MVKISWKTATTPSSAPRTSRVKSGSTVMTAAASIQNHATPSKGRSTSGARNAKPSMRGVSQTTPRTPQRTLRSGLPPGAGVCWRMAIQPSTAITTRSALIRGTPQSGAISSVPPMAPTRMATLMAPESAALAGTSSSGAIREGSAELRAGRKKVDCTPIRKSVTRSASGSWNTNPMAARIIRMISANLAMRMIFVRSNRSAT